MEVRKWNPVDDLTDIQRDISRFFRSAVGIGSDAIGTMWPGARMIPTIDMYTKNGMLIIKSELPGVEASDLNITVKEGNLTIEGERKTKEEIDEKDVYRMESSYGKFRRLVSLPAEVNIENIKASFSNGILTVQIPKTELKEPAGKKVNIETS